MLLLPATAVDTQSHAAVLETPLLPLQSYLSAKLSLFFSNSLTYFTFINLQGSNSKLLQTILHNTVIKYDYLTDTSNNLS